MSLDIELCDHVKQCVGKSIIKRHVASSIILGTRVQARRQNRATNISSSYNPGQQDALWTVDRDGTRTTNGYDSKTKVKIFFMRDFHACNAP